MRINITCFNRIISCWKYVDYLYSVFIKCGNCLLSHDLIILIEKALTGQLLLNVKKLHKIVLDNLITEVLKNIKSNAKWQVYYEFLVFK